MTYFAGMTCFSRQADNADAGIISIIELPGSKRQIGTATHYADKKHPGAYVLHVGGKQLPGMWYLRDGQFYQARESA